MNSILRTVALCAVGTLALVSCAGNDAPDAPDAGSEPPRAVRRTPPAEPEKFAPGRVSTDAYELNLVFSPGLDEFFFTRKVDDVYTMFLSVERDGVWADARPVRLVAGNEAANEVDMSYSPDGQRLYFISNAPTEAFAADSVNIWVSHRSADGWGPAEVLPAPLNTDRNEIYPTAVGDGSLYFSSERAGGQGRFDIYRAQYRDGGFEAPVPLGPAINSSAVEGDIFVSPDESYLVVSSDRDGGRGKSDLYVSVRDAAGEWGPLTPLGDRINTAETDYCPVVSPDGKAFFFSRAGDVYWVDASFLDGFGAASRG